MLSAFAITGGAAYFAMALSGPSLCATLYSETGDERYRTASSWTCYWAHRCARLYAETGDPQYRNASVWACYQAEWRRLLLRKEAVRRQEAAAAEQARARQAAREQTREDDARLIGELRQPVCAALSKFRHPLSGGDDPTVFIIQKPLEIDLLGLSGHSSIYSIEEVCRDCPDLMSSYWDASGARFCTVGGKGGKSCEEAKRFPHTGEAHREGTPSALWDEFGCR